MGLTVRSSPATGNLLLLDTDTVVVTLLGSVNIGGAGSAASGTITDPLFSANAEIFAHLLMRTTSVNTGDVLPTISIGSGVINWSYPATLRPEATILYGLK